MRRKLGKDIYFHQGQPVFESDLSDIDPCYNNIVVLDDLMDIAMDSRIIFLNYSAKEGIETQASYCLYKMCFQKGSTKPV